MDTEQDPTGATVALVGASGRLGSLIGHALLDAPGVRLRVLVRPGSREKVAALEARGAEVVEGALDGDDALAELCRGASTVVSAVQGGPDVIVDGQARLLRAARDAGARRFVPSDYSLDLFRVPPGRIPTSDLRCRFAALADAERGEVEVVHVLNGGFLDRGVLFGFVRVIDPERGTARVWGDGHQPMAWTTYADTARYTAAVAIDPRPVPRVFAVAGDVVDFWGLVAAYESATGQKLAIEREGSLEDLDARIEASKGGDLLSWLPLAYYRSLLSGEGKLEVLMNDRYPEIRPTTVRDYVSREGL